MAFITSVTSSAPARPWLESCSDIAVKPEMSMKATVPSTSRQSCSGVFRSQSMVRRGTNETSSAEADGGEARRVGHADILRRAGRRASKAAGGREERVRPTSARSALHETLTPPQRNPPKKGTSDTSYRTNRRVTPIPKAKGGGMSAAELELVGVSERDRIEQWRHEALERAGYDPEAAIVLAASHDIDLHEAVSLLDRGCSVELALQILL